MNLLKHLGCNLQCRHALRLPGVLFCLHLTCGSLAAATVSWVGPSGDWNTPTNWSTGVLPGTNDDVVIGSGPAITVTHSSGTHGVHSIQSQQAFVLSGGLLSISTTFQASNTFSLSGGTLQSATLSASSTFALVVQSGTLDGVTINGALDVGNSVSSALVTVTNGLGLNGTLLLGNPTNSSFGGLSFAGTQTLSGNGVVRLGNNGNGYNSLCLANNGTTLTIGPAITVRGQSGVVGHSVAFAGSSSANVVNQGTISCDANIGVIQINPQNFVNQGLVQGTNGGTATLTGTITPSAGAFNGTVQLAFGATVQGGTITTLNGSALAASSGVILAGVTVDTNSILDVGNSVSGAEVTVTNGLVLNGTLLVGNPTNNSYGGVGFQGTQTLSGNGTVIFGNNNNGYDGLFPTINGTTLTIGPSVTVRGQNGQIGHSPVFAGASSATVINQGTISGDSTSASIIVNPSTFTTTGRLNGTVQAASGTTILGGTIITINGSTFALDSGVTLNAVTVNGTLDVGSSLGGAGITVTNGLVLNGALLVGNPTNNSYGGVGFQGTQTLSGNGTVIFGNNNNDYNGLFPTLNGTTLTIGPAVTVRGQNGTIGHSPVFASASSATVVNQGAISCDVSGGTITVNPQTFTSTGTFNGPVQANGTTILGGTVVTLNGSSLIINNGVTLNGVTVNGALDVGSSFGGITVTVTNGLVLNGTLLVGNPTNNSYGGVSFVGSQTLSGNGAVIFGNNVNGYNGLFPAVNGTTLTVGPGVTVHGSSGSLGHSPVFASASSASVVNQGSVSCDVSGGTITVNPQNFTNQGALSASAGAVLSLTGSNTLTAGSLTLDLGGAANYGKLNISGNVTLGGALNVNLTGGYVPTAGTSFSIVNYGSESGVFAPTNLPGQALQWQLNYGATTATLSVVSNLASIVDIAYLRSTLDPVNFAPTNTSTLYTAVGVVTTWTNLTSTANTEFFMQDASGGIAVLWSGASASNNLPPAGSIVEVTAPLSEDNGLLVLAPVFSNPLHGVTIQGTSPLPAPQPLPFDTNIVGNPNLMVRHLQGSYFLATNVFLNLATSTFAAGAAEPLTNGSTLPFSLTLFNPTNLTAGTNYTITGTNLPGQTFIISYNSNADFIGQPKLPGPFAI